MDYTGAFCFHGTLFPLLANLTERSEGIDPTSIEMNTKHKPWRVWKSMQRLSLTLRYFGLNSSLFNDSYEELPSGIDS